MGTEKRRQQPKRNMCTNLTEQRRFGKDSEAVLAGAFQEAEK